MCVSRGQRRHVRIIINSHIFSFVFFFHIFWLICWAFETFRNLNDASFLVRSLDFKRTRSQCCTREGDNYEPNGKRRKKIYSLNVLYICVMCRFKCMTQGSISKNSCDNSSTQFRRSVIAADICVFRKKKKAIIAFDFFYLSTNSTWFRLISFSIEKCYEQQRIIHRSLLLNGFKIQNIDLMGNICIKILKINE